MPKLEHYFFERIANELSQAILSHLSLATNFFLENLFRL